MWTSLFMHFAAAPQSICTVKTFLGIPPWYKYLVNSGLMAENSLNTGGAVTKVCELKGVVTPEKWVQVISLVGLAVLDMVLRLAGMVAVAFIIWGGIQYVISQGDPGKTKDAQQTIINALIGLAIALVATAFVSFIGNRIG